MTSTSLLLHEDAATDMTEHSETADCGLLAIYLRCWDIQDFKTTEYCSGQRFSILLDNFCNILHANSRMAKGFSLFIFSFIFCLSQMF